MLLCFMPLYIVNLYRQSGNTVKDVPTLAVLISAALIPVVFSTRQTPVALPHSRKRLESPGAAPGSGPPLHGGVFLCRSRWVSFFLP